MRMGLYYFYSFQQTGSLSSMLDTDAKPKGELQIMPFQNRSKYRQEMQNKGIELYYILFVSIFEENLDLERNIDIITTYQKSYTKKILIVMARANPHNALAWFLIT